jgi:ubiquinol-cytochrome c reductase cytochrome c subunit
VKFLSSRRRHPLAGLVVVLFGLLAVGGVYAAFGPAQADQSSNGTALIAQGRRLFVVSCATCHGLNGEGVITKSGTNTGPSLIGVGAAAVDFQMGTGRMPLAVPGPQGQARRVVFTQSEIEDISAYVASLGPGPVIPSESTYNATGLSAEQIAQGGEFFRTNCTACHNFAGSGGALPSGAAAPKLQGVAAKYIWEALLTGPSQMPKFSNGVLKPQEKREIIAYIHSLAEQPGYGGSKLGSMGPVSEGLFGWVFGIGALILAAAWIGNSGVRARKKKTT